MTAQLYVYRAIMNLEKTADGSLAVGFSSSLQAPFTPASEWAWRKNYRVWQANREVFLWPENYLDPDLRDDMTPLFQELQSQLLQTDITDQNVADAYAAYLAGLEEVASLTIAGAYVDKNPTTPPDAPAFVRDVLHLFGVNSNDPPTYYYRTCQNFLASRDGTTAASWGPWQQITVQITSRNVSPVVYQGRLQVFWIDITTQPQNDITNGSSTFAGYKHQTTLSFTTLRPDGTWTAPQKVALPVDNWFGPAGGQITDPVSGVSTGGQIADLLLGVSAGVAKYDPQFQWETASIDDYTLSGPNWDRVLADFYVDFAGAPIP